MSSPSRPPLRGLWHAALKVRDLEAALRFYRDLVGMRVEWHPDPDNVYLTSGRDNLALHRDATADARQGTLDHLGFALPTRDDVDAWAAWFQAHEWPIERPPRTHRDGARSFYLRDPAGNLVQFLHHPPLDAAP